jgi:hypothetical protein
LRRKWLIPTAILVIAVVIATFVVLKPWESSTGTPAGKDPSSAVVGRDGGTFTFHDTFTVIVPKGAVNGETTLTVTQPQGLKTSDGPFPQLRKAGSAFDITLSQGDKRDIQPAQPLEVTFPLNGAYRPEGAANAIPLLYTPGSTPGSYLWLPTRVENNQMVRVSVGHLSTKYLVYVEGKSLLDAFEPKKVEADRGDCPQEATISGRKIKVKATRWSLNSDSPIFACLLSGPSGSVGVGVTNRVDYILIAAATSGVKNIAVSQGDLEEESVKYVAKLLPGGEKVKAYVGRAGKMTAQITPADLPQTIEIKGDLRTFTAENTVRLLSLAIGMITGDGNAGKTLQLLGKALENGNLVSCLQKSMGPLTEKSSFGDIANAGSSCFGTLFSILAEQIDLGKALWRVGWVADALKGIYDTATSSLNGIRLEFVNTMRIEVQTDAPPCPTGTTLQRALQAAVSPPVKVWNARQIHCQLPYAYGTTEVGVGNPQTDTVMSYVVYYDGKAWKQVASGQDMGENPYCTKAPGFVREWMNCRI